MIFTYSIKKRKYEFNGLKEHVFYNAKKNKFIIISPLDFLSMSSLTLHGILGVYALKQIEHMCYLGEL